MASARGQGRCAPESNQTDVGTGNASRAVSEIARNARNGTFFSRKNAATVALSVSTAMPPVSTASQNLSS